MNQSLKQTLAVQLAELTTLAAMSPLKEREVRIKVIRRFFGMVERLDMIAQKFLRFDTLGAAIWMLDDARKITEEVGHLLQEAKDLQYRTKRLLGPNEVGRRSKEVAVNPGKAIWEFLVAKGVSVEEFADLVGEPKEMVTKTIDCQRPISARMAKVLEEASDASAESWLMHSNLYFLANSKELTEEEAKKVRERFA